MRSVAGSIVVIVAACGGSSAPKAEPPKAEPVASASPVESAASSEEPAAEADAAKKIPDACAGDGGCTMPTAFVRKLCAGVYPDLALMFFVKGSPWRRAYVAVREAAPFNGLNGPSSDEKLVFEEEVLVLSEKKVDTGGMQVSGAGASYDVLRWDGTCATLTAEEVRLSAPPKPKHATLSWRGLADSTQEALLKNEVVAKIASERRKECKGATTGSVTAKCEKVDRRFNDVIVEAVRGGTTVPVPPKVP